MLINALLQNDTTDIFITFENISVSNVTSFATIIEVITDADILTLKNIEFTNVSLSKDEINSLRTVSNGALNINNLK